MTVTIKDVEYVSSLAKHSFPEEEKKKLTEHLNEILEYMEHLNQVDTTQVEPLLHVIELKNVFRPDEVGPTLTREEALRNAPAKTEEFFRVPKVIGER
jgi:aspartyl-tRNA(Asn)/glutamyl-tRNA(Gln) amidotransferase subunit C